MKIAVDFDGTIVEAAYPEIGEEKLFAFKTLLELQKRGHQLILWTSRVGKELDDAVEYCRKKGVEFYAVNKNYPEEILDDTISRKIVTDLYIDDRVVGGFPGWGEIFQILHPGDPVYARELSNSTRKKSALLSGLKKILGNSFI
jgi:hydroxymethylpyrimidine pyrophosphatase-like HAD family hydrolase